MKDKVFIIAMLACWVAISIAFAKIGQLEKEAERQSVDTIQMAVNAVNYCEDRVNGLQDQLEERLGTLERVVDILNTIFDEEARKGHAVH